MPRKLALLAALVAVFVLGFTQTASASITRYAEFSTAGRGAPGYATATMAVTWNSATNADIGASITDHCPANGMGAYLHLRLRTSAGTYHRLGTSPVADGCDTTRSGYITSVAGLYGRISHIDGRLCEEDRDGNLASICTAWKEIDNPYT